MESNSLPQDENGHLSDRPADPDAATVEDDASPDEDALRRAVLGPEALATAAATARARGDIEAATAADRAHAEAVEAAEEAAREREARES